MAPTQPMTFGHYCGLLITNLREVQPLLSTFISIISQLGKADGRPIHGLGSVRGF